jgi:oligopeptide/dipeptide ABC transporter ATP-binding protein
MYLGKFVETGSGEDIYLRPQHPYTRSLISSIPVPDPHREVQRQLLAGDVPSPIDPPSGCAFHPRCPMAMAQCRQAAPQLEDTAPGHQVSCHLEFASTSP